MKKTLLLMAMMGAVCAARAEFKTLGVMIDVSRGRVLKVDYLKTRRIEQAAVLLRQGYRINEVAERVGFSSSSYFAKCFKARFGVLPKDFVTK